MLKRLLRKTIIGVVTDHMVEHMEEELETTEVFPEYNVGFIQFRNGTFRPSTQHKENNNDL